MSEILIKHNAFKAYCKNHYLSEETANSKEAFNLYLRLERHFIEPEQKYNKVIALRTLGIRC